MKQDAVLETLREGPPVLITGAAGFIGFHVARRLLDADVPVVGVDSLSPYYDLALKRARLSVLARSPGFRLLEIDLARPALALQPLAEIAPRYVVHLAAQAGVRHSIEQPFAYADSNLTGFLTVLEACRYGKIEHLLYASSSSVYGGNGALPFSTRHAVDHPVSLYAATKKANELMAHSYSHLYGVPATGLRFFTVYGPWGRPDMAYWRFAEAIWADRPIDLYNYGAAKRDFTYVDDVVDAMIHLLTAAPRPDPAFDRMRPSPASSWAPHRVYNVGANRPEPLEDLVAALERAIGRKAQRRLMPMQPGDVVETWADVTDLVQAIGPTPTVPLAVGVERFVDWMRTWRTGRAVAVAQ